MAENIVTCLKTLSWIRTTGCGASSEPIMGIYFQPLDLGSYKFIAVIPIYKDSRDKH